MWRTVSEKDGKEDARGYANATLKQALIIAVRMVDNLR